MGFFKIDLTTRDGAENAARSGSLGAFIAAALTGIAGIYTLVTAPLLTNMLVAVGVILFLELLVFIVAGFRLRAGKGLIWTGAAAVLLILQTLSQLVGFGLLGLLVRLSLLLNLIEGMRGAWALRRDSFAEEVAEVFN